MRAIQAARTEEPQGVVVIESAATEVYVVGGCANSCKPRVCIRNDQVRMADSRQRAVDVLAERCLQGVVNRAPAGEVSKPLSNIGIYTLKCCCCARSAAAERTAG